MVEGLVPSLGQASVSNGALKYNEQYWTFINIKNVPKMHLQKGSSV